MTKEQVRLVEAIRHRLGYRLEKRKLNVAYGLISEERKSPRPTAVEDVETLLGILDELTFAPKEKL